MMIMPRAAARLENARLMDWMISSQAEPVLFLSGRISPRPSTSVSIIMMTPAVNNTGWAGYFLSTSRVTQTTAIRAISNPNIKGPS